MISDGDDISVLVACVNYRRPEDTLACVSSLRASVISKGRVTVAVCDNSPGHSAGRLRQGLDDIFGRHSGVDVGENSTQWALGESFSVFLYDSPDNIGFAGGNNACLRVAGALKIPVSHYWFLNNDTEIEPDCLEKMLNKIRCEGMKVGACGSTMVYYHDKKTVQALGGSEYHPWTGTMQEIGNGNTWPLPVDESLVESRMSYVCGASMLVTAEFVRDVGPMNEDYFLFFEEIDWCERARKAGYSLAYASQAVVYHKEGASIGTGTGAKRSLLAEYYGMRNKLLVSWRFFPWALPSVWLISWLQVARRVAQRRPRNAWVMIRVLLGFGRRPV